MLSTQSRCCSLAVVSSLLVSLNLNLFLLPRVPLEPPFSAICLLGEEVQSGGLGGCSLSHLGGAHPAPAAVRSRRFHRGPLGLSALQGQPVPHLVPVTEGASGALQKKKKKVGNNTALEGKHALCFGGGSVTGFTPGAVRRAVSCCGLEERWLLANKMAEMVGGEGLGSEQHQVRMWRLA